MSHSDPETPYPGFEWPAGYAPLTTEQAAPLILRHGRTCTNPDHDGYGELDAVVTIVLLTRGEILAAIAPGGSLRTRVTTRYQIGREDAWLN